MAEWLPLSSGRVLDKRPLLAQSVANLITLDQSIEGRQDEKHLRLAVANCAEFLRVHRIRSRARPALDRQAGRF